MSILIVMEQRSGVWNRMSFETLGAAQQLAGELKTTASAAVLGQGIEALAGDLAGKQLEKVYVVEHELLKEYTPDAYTAALRQLLARVNPEYVLLPHTYQVRDFLPKLATALGTVAVSDVVAHRVEAGALVLVRQLFQGKVNSDVRFTGAAPHFASLQAGAYRADQVVEGAAALEKFTPALAAGDVRTRPLERFRESARAVDLSAAELIVAVGRGIKEADNIALIQELAGAMGAELAASRPICDAGWLPMERQVGSSGQTVAINKDPNAPIFEVADYGIVGDLFQVVPELIDALKKAK